MPDNIPTISAKYIDVDFPKDPRYVFGDKGTRPDIQLFKGRFSDEEEVISESKWPEEIQAIEDAGGGLERFVTRIYDQKSEGSCVANAFSQAHEVCQYRQYGLVIPLSAISLYKRIGNSPGSGANVGHGMKEARDNGILPLDTEENRKIFGDCVMPNTGFYTKYPSGYQRVMKEFVIVEYLILESMEELVSAGIKQWPVVVGRKGHSICYLRPKYINGRLTYGYANSWRIDWGSPWGNLSGGFGFDSVNNIMASSDYAVCIRTVKARRVVSPALSLAL